MLDATVEFSLTELDSVLIRGRLSMLVMEV